MKYLQVSFLGVCLFLTSISAMASQGKDEAAIRKTIERAFHGLNRHDMKAHLSAFAEDYEDWTGSQKGLKAREKRWTELWQRQKNDQHKPIKEIGIVSVTPDVAIYKARCVSTGEMEEDGTPIPRNEWLGAWVLVKKGGDWLITAFFYRPIEE